jgi:alginate O-acetyltransferase complex protein AlgI
MLGFRFPENFNQPYRSHSVTEFWRRWHMTLSRWFRDYLYIPLGGNRVGATRTVVNLFIVFFLCGLWHGASYNFIVWGLYHGTLLATERLLKHRFLFEPRGLLGWLYTSLAVLVGWIIFRAPTLPLAWSYMHVLVAGAPASRYPVRFFLTPDKITYLLVGIILALLPPRTSAKPAPRSSTIAHTTLATLCFVFAIMEIAANGFNPFIYFRF